ncbi:MAG: GlsB/YeaQ/YmgE family stress response membrane protein [Pseudolabrys sp.]|nr:GlsB/YeaQ/YmgE family stress response membrane protein [Pseudolabrys sp.]MBV9955090.1 GlsB/YeaQ/YmgE family stress response membrane protein [Pseudolabrys sp.]
MEPEPIGWVASILIGGFAGWLAEKFMQSNMGMIANIVLGMIGAAFATWLFGLAGIRLPSPWLGYLIAGFIGACILIALSRLAGGRRL